MKSLTRTALCLALLSALSAAQAFAQAAPAASAAAPAEGGFSKEQLEQLVAPIALYPDSLLTQILMASTYPLEIVQAQRWFAKNSSLKGSALEAALKEQDWDASVKSLTGFPEVLNKMGDNLDWTQDLGDAFLEQQAALLDTVQVMRGKAEKSGNLKSSEQIVVKEEADNIIVIESADPEVVYVPQYAPTAVYGGWGYSSYYYPPMYPYYPPGAGLLAFGVGVAWGAAMWGNCDWGWGNSDVNIDVDRQNNFNRNTNINGGDRVNHNNRGQGGAGNKAGWNHDASHRKGVNYRDSKTASKFGGTGATNRISDNQARGRTGSASGARPSTGMGAGAGTRPTTGGASRPSQGALNLPSSSAGSRPSGGASARTSPSTRPSGGASTRPSTGSSGRTSQYSSGTSAYSGSRSSSSAARSSSSRGSSSRSSYSGGASRGGGGGSRGGGGGGRGGGGRR